MSNETKVKHKPNYYLILPDGTAASIYIKNMEVAKSILMEMKETVKLIKIKR